MRRVLIEDGRPVLGYVFGSVASGRLGPLSDVDVGVLLPKEAEREAVHGEIQDSLCRALRTDRVDLILLDTAPAPLRYRVVRDGKLVLCRDERCRERFESESVLEYLDFKPLRDQMFRTAREAILRTE